MTRKLDELEQLAVDFIENGGDLPETLGAQERWKFTATMFKYTCTQIGEHVDDKELHRSLKDMISLKVIGIFVLAVACIHSAMPPGITLWELIDKILP